MSVSPALAQCLARCGYSANASWPEMDFLSCNQQSVLQGDWPGSQNKMKPFLKGPLELCLVLGAKCRKLLTVNVRAWKAHSIQNLMEPICLESILTRLHVRRISLIMWLSSGTWIWGSDGYSLLKSCIIYDFGKDYLEWVGKHEQRLLIVSLCNRIAQLWALDMGWVFGSFPWNDVALREWVLGLDT